jgi:hypothetical protein
MPARWDDGDHELERRLATRARSQGALRAAVARVAARLVARRASEPLGYARLADYARERLGKSARSLYEEAAVGEAFVRAPRLERALAHGELPWTQVRALARLTSSEAVERWLPYARANTAATLDREIRRVEHCSQSLWAEDREPRETVEIPCTRRVRGKWHHAVSLARNVAAYSLDPGAAAEMIAAEVLSGLEVDEGFRVDDGTVQNALVDGAADPPEAVVAVEPVEDLAAAEALRDVARFVEGIESADPAELDRRMRALLQREQRLEAELGPLLARVARRRVFRALGFASLDAYSRERLGIDPAKARALLRLERAAVLSPALENAYRTGALSWVAAEAVVPVILADSLGRFGEDWVELAKRVTVRRLREDVERAVLAYEADPATWARTGGLPDRLAADVRAREIGAQKPPRDGAPRKDETPEVLPSGWVRLPGGALIDPVVWRLMQDDPDAGECDTCLVRFRAPRSIAASSARSTRAFAAVSAERPARRSKRCSTT